MEDNSNNVKMGNGNTILLTVIGISTLLVALVGATFAYFTAAVSNAKAQSVKVQTATPVGLEYLGSADSLQLLNALPGVTKKSTFTVKNPAGSKVAQQYSLKFIVDANDFSTKSGPKQLTLKISGATDNKKDEGFSTAAPSVTVTDWDLTDGSGTYKTGSSTPFVVNAPISPNETHTYTLDLAFVDLKKPQDENQGKNFAAHIEIYDPKAI